MKIGFGVALLVSTLGDSFAQAESSDQAAAWNCRNVQIEATCADGECTVSEAHTPMDVSVDAGEMSVCAYSGCWIGRPAVTVSSGSFITFTGLKLPFSTSPDGHADISVAIETVSRVATILVSGSFATPATCELITR